MNNLSNESGKAILANSVAGNPEKIHLETTKKSKKSVVFSITLPVFTAVFMVATLTVFYFHEQTINAEVIELKQKGEQLALAANYEAAIIKLDSAVELRPGYKAVQKSLSAVRLAHKFNNQLASAGELIKNQDYAASEKLLTEVQEGLSSQSGELYAPLVEKADKQAVTLKVISIKKEIEPLNNVAELGGKLSVLNTISSSEGEAVKKQVINKIVEVTLKDASTKLEDNQFSEAAASVESGLKYATNHEKLTAYKTKIEQEQLAFEEAERTRIEKALEEAAKEDLLNRTAAVDVISIEWEVDEYGDLNLYGDIENVSTSNLSSITIYYSIYDSFGSYVTDSFTTLDTYYLNVGEKGSFSDSYYGIYDEGATVEIDNITWYLE
ncbi:hypothetical protein ACQKE5_03960 [Paenisporosarcina sp. NPDC076898]|uniref:hypothetical protein n=1 Tax=Paenisporosarcina sp. NPDC076898 TaxID=3390603 RepID=UPI003D066E3A